MVPKDSLRRAAVLAAALAVAGCGSSEPATPISDTGAPPAAHDAAPARPRVVCLGDSLTAGLGVAAAEAYPALLEARLARAGFDAQVVNAGVSGDTSAGGLRRVDWALDGDVRVLIVALGGNDGLRGLPPDELRRNLSGIVERAQARGVSVLLAGMEAPPNFGAEYTRAFRQVYPDVARETGATLIPFLLEGVAGEPELNQGDGIHPTAEGQRRMAEIVWRHLEPVARARFSS